MKKNKIGFSASISLVIANMVGVGIFTSLGFQLMDLKNYFTVLLLWILGGIHALLGSFCYSELSASFPKSGGEYHFLRISFGHFTGFLSGWTSAILGFAAPIAAASFAFSNYFDHLFLSNFSPHFIAIAIITIITIIHCLQINTGAKFQVYITATKVLLIIVFIIIGLYKSTTNQYNDVSTNFIWSKQIANDLLIPGFWIGLIFVSYAYSGWNATSYIIDEIDQPQKNVPRSILIGTIVVAVLYTLINYVFLISANATELINAKVDVAYVSAKRIFGMHGAQIVSSVISFLLISTISSMIMVGPRVIKRIAEDYKEFSFFSTNNKNNIPIRAILLQSSIAILLLITSSFEFIVTCIGFVLCIFTTLTALSVIILRWKNPNTPRPIKVPLYPLTPLLFSSFNIWIMIYLLKNKTMESITGLLFVAIGGILYLFMQSKNKNSIKRIVSIFIVSFLFSCNNNDNNSPKKSDDNTKKDATQETTPFKIDSALNTKALFLSGLDSNSTAMTDNQKVMIDNINSSWNECYTKILSPIKQWMHDETYDQTVKSRSFVFYPFSGPDFAFANSFYPNAKCYVMAGLETAGNDKANIFSKSKNDSGFFKNAQEYFKYSSTYGFFITKQMEKQFKDKGVVDILAFYLKKMNCEIGEIKISNWDSQNKNFTPVTKGKDGNVCYILFKQPSGMVSELYYFSKDLSDEGLKTDANWLNWVKEKAKNSTMVSLTKSASYLMHGEYFSIVRDFILNNSKLHIQDDSGIGYKYITASNRPYTLYGKFSKVIPVFDYRMQKDLALKYKTDSSIKALPFAIGYNLRFNESNLIVVKEKK